MISEPQRAQILQLLQSPQWKAAEDLSNELCDSIQWESTLKDTEWETLRETVLSEGEVRGIKRFISELYKEARNVKT